MSGESRTTAGRSSGLTRRLVAGAALVVLAGGGAAAMLLLGGGSGRKAGAAAVRAGQVVQAVRAGQAVLVGQTGRAVQAVQAGQDGTGGGPVVELLVPFDTFVVNLADPGGDRLLKATIRAVLNDAEVAEELQRDELTRSRVRDRILSVLTSKTAEDVTSRGGKDSLRLHLQREINQALPDDVVSEVLFVEFVIQ